MWVEFRHTLIRYKNQILVWGVGISLFSVLLNFFSSAGSMFQNFFRFSPFLLGGFAVQSGLELSGRVEKKSNLKNNPSSPLFWSRVFWGRFLGYVVSQVLILFAVYVCWVGICRLTELNLTPAELVRPFISLLGILVLFHAFTLLLGTLFSSPRMAGTISVGLIGGNFLLEGLAKNYPFFGKITGYLPLALYQGAGAVTGASADAAVIILELICLLLLLSWWRLLDAHCKVEFVKTTGLQFLSHSGKKRKETGQSRKWLQPAFYFGRRVVFGLLVLTFITYSSFVGLDMARGKTFSEAATLGVRKTYEYAGDVLAGDLGETSSGSVSLLPKPVEEVVPDVLIRSLGLLAVSLSGAAVLGVFLGVIIAGKRSGVTLLALLGSIVGVSIPSFFAALLLQLGVIQITQKTGSQILPVGGFGWDNHLILPALVLAARPLAQITRVTFVTVEDILAQDYIRTAYSKGLRSLRVSAVHIIRNAAVPVLTTIGLSLRFALSSLPVVEYFFGWQGIGFTLLQSISNRDDTLTIVLACCLGILFILVNILLDGAYLIIDPRLREKKGVVKQSRKKSLSEIFKSITKWFQKLFRNPPWLRLFKKPETTGPSPFRKLIDDHQDDFEYNDFLEMSKHRARIWLKSTLGNPALIAGSLIILVLLMVIVLGPQLAPHSPYTMQGMSFEGGEFSVPPFPPDEIHPWGTDPLGRDIMSLIIAGAQQTFSLAFSVVAVRLLIGFVLGAVVGWFSGSWLDRFVLGIAETISAFPAILFVMVLILGIGIREGIRPFVIALSFVGWAEIMQYIRSKVMEIKPKLFIESAEAVGAGTDRIITKHIFPNLIPGLISLLALEMGAVLMLLGELGFIGIFIGGGAFAELEIWGPPYHYSDVPEWGALLSNIRIYARSYPWTALYPASAFFVAIIGFNLLGEGFRRLIEQVGVTATRVFVNKYTLAVAGVLVAGFFWLRGATGSIGVFQEQAEMFNGYYAMAHMQALTDPMMQGRSLGSDGTDLTAAYIAHQFEEMGLQPAGESMTYYQTRSRSFEALDAEPRLELIGDDYEPVYHRDFVEFVGRNQNKGSVTAPVRFFASGDLLVIGQWLRETPALENLDFSGEIVMVLSERDAAILEQVPRAGVLVVEDEPALMSQAVTLSARNPWFNPLVSEEPLEWKKPMMRISLEVANRLLEGTEYTIDELQYFADDLGQDEIVNFSTGKSVSMNIEGTVADDVEVKNVIGHLPGMKSNPQAQLDNQLIVVMAQYDSPPRVGSQPVSDFANNNAAGVAVMLELIRTFQESGYQPNKTFLFIAYAGEGQEGGEWVQPEIAKFLQTKYGFSSTLETEAVIEIRGVGAGSGNQLLLSTEGSLRLGDLFESSAKRLGVPVSRAENQLDLSVLFEEDVNPQASGDEAPIVGVFWDQWWETGGTAADNMETIDISKLDQSGKVITLASMVVGHELNY